jgi:hypothetical protein
MSKFNQLKAKLAKRPGVTDPGGLAASIGRKKFGPKNMAKAAAIGKPAAQVK